MPREAPLTVAVDPAAESSALLVRACNGPKDKAAKTKIATTVEPADLEQFFARYAEVCKAGMGSLKKRDRRKKKASKKKPVV